MAMQKITILLRALAESMTTRSSRGIVCLVLDDEKVTGLYEYTRSKQVTESYSEENKKFITRCFSEWGVKKLKVVCYNSKKSDVAEKISDGLKLLDGIKFNYLACPTATETEGKQAIANFIKEQRKNGNILVKAVLNDHEGDYEGLINFINTQITLSDDTVLTGAEFTVDMACACATTELNSSLTNKVMSGIKSVDSVGDDLDSLVDEGKLFLFYDNDLESIVVSKAVNSKTTIGPNEKESLKKIRVVDILDMIQDDMKVTFKKSYQGKVENSLANKKLLVSAYNVYLRTITKQGALNSGEINEVALDVESQGAYLESKGIDISELTDEQILAKDTDEKVFISGRIYVVDAMEDLDLVLNY